MYFIVKIKLLHLYRNVVYMTMILTEKKLNQK